MRFIAGLIFIGLFGLLHNFLVQGIATPWWGLFLGVFLTGFALQLHGLVSFLCGALGVGAFWGIHTYLLDQANNHELANQVAQLLLGDLMSEPSGQVLWLATVTIGAVLGGLSMLTGRLARDLISPKSKSRRLR